MEKILRHDSWEADISKLRLSDGTIYFINTASINVSLHMYVFGFICLRWKDMFIGVCLCSPRFSKTPHQIIYSCMYSYLFDSFSEKPLSKTK